jgi:hypothetical protein
MKTKENNKHNTQFNNINLSNSHMASPILVPKQRNPHNFLYIIYIYDKNLNLNSHTRIF